MDYKIEGLDPRRFEYLWGRDDAGLAAHRARRLRVDSEPGFPDRISLRDAPLNASIILVNYEHMAVHSPYRSSHAIFVLEGCVERFSRVGEIPPCLLGRSLSVRAFDHEAMMVTAELVEGPSLDSCLKDIFRSKHVSHVDIHFAAAGCFFARATGVR
ncbi:DUF1203 domain-containing protein [Wenzhouxiangella sp. XN24]|uniref:DUF1203 domain-containing protein n=1 Tax=Wenzhouxiangella sp. XN24 TaxID=2713569 RepID=UPI0013EC1778|nr:DUF1203 domain-containing protein [Wenzhouxiangella sp. XN24]NGX16579.1 DUF1203 domain-containing protein [Wenzhouxiangella sp. XN24]